MKPPPPAKAIGRTCSNREGVEGGGDGGGGQRGPGGGELP